MTITAYPLAWPAGWKRTESYRRTRAKFGKASRARPGGGWVVAGGESGRNARPMHPDWALSLRDQCEAADVPFLFKQWGEWVPMMGHTEGVPVHGAKHSFPDGTVMGRAGKRDAGRQLDGFVWDQYPEATQ